MFLPWLLKVLEQKDKRIAPGTLYGSSHTYVSLTLKHVTCSPGFVFSWSIIRDVSHIACAWFTGTCWEHKINHQLRKE
jgi:hypothetical protein